MEINFDLVFVQLLQMKCQIEFYLWKIQLFCFVCEYSCEDFEYYSSKLHYEFIEKRFQREIVWDWQWEGDFYEYRNKCLEKLLVRDIVSISSHTISSLNRKKL